MKGLIIIIGYLTIAIRIFGQNTDSTIDSLEKFVTSYTTVDTLRINKLVTLERLYYNSSIEKFGTHIKEMRESSIKINYNYGIGKSYFYSCYYEQLNGNYLKALEDIYKAIEYVKKDNNDIQLALNYGLLSSLLLRNTSYSDKKINEKNALFYIKLGLDHAYKSKHTMTIHNLIVKNILLYLDFNDIKSAREILEKGKENAKNFKDPVYNIDIYIQEGSVCIQEGKYKEAIQVLNTAQKMATALNASTFLGLIYSHTADAYFKLKEYKIAEEYYLKSYKENTLKSPDVQLEIIRSLKEFYEETKDYKKGLYYSDLYHTIKDSVGKISNVHDFNELMFKYNTAIQDKENQELKNQNLKRERDLKFIIGILAILGIGIVILAYLYRRLLNTKQKLTLANQELEVSNHNKDVIFKIVSHDLKMPINNLLLLTKRLDTKLQDIDKEWLQSYSKQINLIAVDTVETVNNLLYWSNKEANRTAFIENIYVYDCIHDIFDTFLIYAKLLEKSIKYDFDDKDAVIQCNRVLFNTLLKNLISNAIKYSPKEGGKVQITSCAKDKTTIITIEDNGNGKADVLNAYFLSSNTISETKLGMGFKICKEIVDNYNINIRFEQSEKLGGIKVILTI